MRLSIILNDPLPSAVAPPQFGVSTPPTVHAPPNAPLLQSASSSMLASSQNPSSAQTSPASSLLHKGGHAPQTPPSCFPRPVFGTTTQPTPVRGAQGAQYQGHSGEGQGPYRAPVPQSQGGGSLQSTSAGSSRQTTEQQRLIKKREQNSRFQQHRKEKELALQQRTKDLERRVREVEQERDLYRGERDRLKDILSRTPGTRDVGMEAPPGPVSIPPASPLRGNCQEPRGRNRPSYVAPSRPKLQMKKINAQGSFPSLPYSTPPASTLPGYQPTSPSPQSLLPLRLRALAST